MDRLIKGQTTLIRKAQKLQKEKDEAHLHPEGVPTQPTIFSPGDYILAKHENPAHAPKKGEAVWLCDYLPFVRKEEIES